MPRGRPGERREATGNLHEAITRGDLERVKEIVNNATPGYSEKKILAIGLSISCDKEQLETAEYLLSRGADPNAIATGKLPPLLKAVEACAYGDRPLAIVQLLLKHGANTESKNQLGRTALMLATARDVAELLLNSGAEVNATDNEKRTPIMHARRADMVDLLVERNANIHARDNERRTALIISVIEDDSPAIADFLIDHGADIHAADSMGRTVLVTAVWRNRLAFVDTLLERGARVSDKDARGRNVFHHIAGDSDRRLERDDGPGTQILRALLRKSKREDLEAQDVRQRRCLHWATATGNLFATKLLLEVGKVEVDPLEHNRRTPLHLAARVSLTAQHVEVGEGNQTADTGSVNDEAVDDANLTQRKREQLRKQQKIREKLRQEAQARRTELLARLTGVVSSLLAYGANVNAEADGGWTPLHTACADQGVVEVTNQLVAAKAHLNQRTHSGKTGFHLACENGNVAVVQRLLTNTAVKITTKDNYGNSPLLGAAIRHHDAVIRLLAPWTQAHVDRLTPEAKGAAEKFNATIVHFGDYKRGNAVDKSKSVFDVLYSDPNARGRDANTVRTTQNADEPTVFRWVHLPVNNVSWCQELLTKRFIEEGAVDVEGFKALERSFIHQHRGQKVHSSYMRPMCQTVQRTVRPSEDEAPVSAGQEPQSPTKAGAPKVENQPPTPPVAATGSVAANQPQNSAASDPFGVDVAIDADELNLRISPAPPALRRRSTARSTQGNFLSVPGPTPAFGGIERASTAESFEERQPNRSRTVERQNTAARKRRASSGPRVSVDNLASAHDHNVFLFAPYLHFETDKERSEMQDAVERAGLQYSQSRQTTITFQESPEELLIRAHLHPSSAALHIRRTLDQSFYRNIDTALRDKDQVVYRYEKKLLEEGGHPENLKVLMVDQLWMWIIGKDLLVTSFPQRWRQPRRDPLNVLESIIEEINSNTGETVRNIYELASIIVGRCFMTFDRSSVRLDGSKFLDMFESSIGLAMDDETKLFANFKDASQKVSQFLRRTQQALQTTDSVARDQIDTEEPNNAAAHPEDGNPIQEPGEIQTLMDIGQEITLLSDVKDIRDELDMLKMVFEQQRLVGPQVHEAIDAIFGSNTNLKEQRIKIERRLGHHGRAIDHSVKEIERMDKQAKRIYNSIRDLLDLKQKHANASEARYARYQAEETARQGRETARQGKTLMVFTIVTVIFLPLSFIAAFFAINIDEFPHVGNSQEMSIAYVSKYVFGIGLSVALICVIAALSIDNIGKRIRRLREHARASGTGKPPRRGDAASSSVSATTSAPLLDEKAEAFTTARVRSWRSVASSRLSGERPRPEEAV